MSETDLVQRVDSAEMADLFSKSFLGDGEDFLSSTTELTFNDVRRLNLNSGEKGTERRQQRQYEPARPTNWEALRGREPSSELDLRATREEDSWLSAPPSPKKAPIRRSNSVEEYLRMKDASRPSFNKRSTSSSVEVASHVKPSSKGLDRLVRAKPSGYVRPADSIERRASLDGYRRRAVSPGRESRHGMGSSSEKPTTQIFDRRQSAGAPRRSKVSSPAPSRYGGVEGSRRPSSRASNDSFASFDGSEFATPTSAIDPPCSPSSSRTSVGGRERPSRPHSALSCHTRMGGSSRRSESPKLPSKTERLSRRGSRSFGWAGGPGSDTDPLSPKSCASEGGRISFSRDSHPRDSHFSDGEEGISRQTPKHRLFGRGLQKTGKSKPVPEAQKGTRLKPKQEARLARPWKSSREL